MTASVKLSAKTARLLLELLSGGPGIYGVARERIEEELKQALAKSQRASTVRKLLAAPKKEKRATKRQATKDVRHRVRERAVGKCEACGLNLMGMDSFHCDHFFGRAREESFETCWALCPPCDREKTENKPNAAWWLTAFLRHCETFGYSAAAVKAQARLQWVEARGTP